MAKRWHIRSHDPASIASLQRAAGVPDVVAQLLICRGITDPAKARSFLDPKLTDLYDPEMLPGCREAAQRIKAADVARLRRMMEEESEALRRGDRRRAIRLSGGFHMAVAAICGEGALTQFLGSLISRSSLVIALYGRGPASACGHDEHFEFLDALAAGDSDRAAAAMAEHLDHIVADLALAERPEAPVDLAEILTL